MRRESLLFITCIGCALPALAQKSITDSTFQVGNVEVVAYKKQAPQDRPVELMGMNVPLKYLPMTVTRLDGITLERKHILNMQDAVRFLPGVVMTSNQLGAFQRYSVRGTTDAVFAYDGIRDDRTLLNTVPFGDLSAVESIEVIKGPASILAGYSVMGGVINIIRKKASERFTADASISYGSWDQKEANVGFGGKLLGPLNYRANVHYANGDGYRMVNADRFSGLFAIGTEITKKGYLEANVSFNNDHYTTDIGGPSTMPGDVYSVADNKLFAAKGERHPWADYEAVWNDIANNKMHRRNVDVMVDYKHELTRWMSLRERFSYGHSNLDYAAVERVGYRTSEEPIYDYWYINSRNNKKYYIDMDSVQSGEPLTFNPDNYSYTNTVELTGKFFTNILTHHYTAGWNYSFFDYTQYNGYNEGDLWGPGLYEMVSIKEPHYVRDWWDSKVSAASIRRFITNGFYLHDVIEVNDHWKGMVALRYDTYRYKNASATIDDGRQHYEQANRTDWKTNTTGALTYRVGAVYLPIPEVSIYASAASFFKPYNTMYNPNTRYFDRNGNEFNPDKVDGEVYRPQRGNQFELGARYALNHLLEVNGSVFYIRKNNVVRNVGQIDVEEDGATVQKTLQAQIGREASKGFDLDVTLRPVSTLQITGGWGWSDYRTIASNIEALKKIPGATYNEDGSINLRQTGVPRTTFYTYADYTIPKGVLKDLSFHLSGTYTDRIYRDIQTNLYDPARYIVDAGIYYTIKERVTLAVNLYNLFNEKYFESTTRLAKPFNFMSTIAYHFR